MPDTVIRGYFDRPLPAKPEPKLDIGRSLNEILRIAIRKHALILGGERTAQIMREELEIMQSKDPA
jgi:hypothetical protein